MRSSFILVVSLVTLWCSAARADLVQECYEAVNAGTATACGLCAKAVANSDGAARTVAQINLARCEEKRGRLVRALTTYRDVRGALAENDDRRTAVDERIRELEGRIGKLRLDWSKAPPTAELLLDEQSVTGRPSEIAVDPGKHRTTLRAGGYDDRSEAIDVPEGGAAEVVLLPGATQGSQSEPAEDDGQGQKIAAYTVGALGVAGIIVFAATGGVILDRQSTVDELCPERDDGVRVCSDARGLEAADEGKTLNVVNAVSLGVGVAALVTGLVLWFTAPDTDADVSLDASPHGIGLGVRGRF